MNYCPQCGDPILEDEKYCPNCGYNLSARKTLKQSFENSNSEVIEEHQIDETVKDNENSNSTIVKRKRNVSLLSIVAFVCSLTLILSPLGVILAIIDLFRKKYNLKGFSVAALIIGGLITYLMISSSGNSSSNNKTEVAYESKDQFINSCVTVNYEDVAREPDSYKGKRIQVTGKVIQVSEGYNNSITLRVASGRNSYDDIWYVTYKRPNDEARILEDDYLILYGECDGVKTYKTILGARVTIPSIKAKYVTIER